MKQIKANLFSATRSVFQRGTVAILCTFIFGLFLIAGCKKDKPNGIKEPEYPIEIPVTEYTLPDFCNWKNLDYDEKVIVINSAEELEKYVSCTGENYPEFDFSAGSLLLLSGGTERGVSAKSQRLQQLSANQYQWDVEILLDETGDVEPWIIAVAASKQVNESTIELNVITSNIEYPIEVPFINYYLITNTQGSCWYWNNLKYDDSIIVIENDEEFEKYANLDYCHGNMRIDFSKQTLLLASGTTTADVLEISKKLLKSSSNKYLLDINLRLNTTHYWKEWVVSIIVKKIINNSDFELSVSTFENDWECDCKDELFFYNYLGNKVGLANMFIESYLSVWFKDNVENEDIISCIKQTGLFENVDVNNIHKNISSYEYNYFSMIFVKTKERASCIRLKEIINKLYENHSVTYADIIYHQHYSFFDQYDVCSNGYGLLVYLKDENNLENLQTLAQETNTIVVKLSTLSSYIILIDKYSSGSVLQLAQYFWETELFVEVVPLYGFYQNVLR